MHCMHGQQGSRQWGQGGGCEEGYFYKKGVYSVKRI